MLDQIKVDILDGIVKIIEDKNINTEYREFLKFVYNYIDNNIKKRYVYNTNPYIGIMKSLKFDQLLIHYNNIIKECAKVYSETFVLLHSYFEIPQSQLEHFKTHFDEKINEDDLYTCVHGSYTFYNRVAAKELMLSFISKYFDFDYILDNNELECKKLVAQYIDNNLLHR